MNANLGIRLQAVPKEERPIATATRSPNWFVGFYASALGKKVAMGLSGIFLFGFVFAHMAGNLKVFLGAEEFNAYAEFLRTMGEPAVPHGSLLWVMRLGLMAAVMVHIVAAIQLTIINRRARPTRYAARRTVQAGYAERTMRWSGLLIALYVVYHLMHFTWGNAHPDFIAGSPYHNVIQGFRAWPVAAVYIGANLLLGLHLHHGVWSLFQSLGWNHPRYNPWRRRFAAVFALIVTAGFIAVPVAVLSGLIS